MFDGRNGIIRDDGFLLPRTDLVSSKRLKRIYFVASFHARTKPWSLIEPIVIRSGFRAEGLAPPFEDIDQNPPVINDFGVVQNRFEGFIDRDTGGRQ